jgi:transcriptional regulator with XRE-family HTH domain
MAGIPYNLYSFGVLLMAENNHKIGGEYHMDTQFVRDRITQLRLKKGVSEYQMSYDLGHSRSYVYNISSGKSLPPMAEFLQICNYFDITPSQFFDESEENPALLQTAIEELRKLNDDDLMLIIGNIRRLTRE